MHSACKLASWELKIGVPLFSRSWLGEWLGPRFAQQNLRTVQRKSEGSRKREKRKKNKNKDEEKDEKIKKKSEDKKS